MPFAGCTGHRRLPARQGGMPDAGCGLRELRTARTTVEELRRRLDAGENPVILDLRSKAELEQNPSVIRGATHLVLDEIEQRRPEFPHDRDIIVYCSCPNEVTSARVALLLQRKGFTRVRHLLRGN